LVLQACGRAIGSHPLHRAQSIILNHQLNFFLILCQEHVTHRKVAWLAKTWVLAYVTGAGCTPCIPSLPRSTCARLISPREDSGGT
jgi:hypothetical protein